MAYRETGARFSIDRRNRYALWRVWGHDEDICNFLLLNPSIADEVTNDPTSVRCERRARRWGFGGLIVTNLFALCATDPAGLRRVADPIGPENDAAILEAARGCNRALERTVLLKGSLQPPPGRSRAQSRSRTARLPDPWRRGRGSPQRRPIPRNLRGKRWIGAASTRIFR